MDPMRMFQGALDQSEQVRAAMAQERHRVFERLSETGLCRVFVDLDGNLAEVVFLRNDVFDLEEPTAVAAEALATIKAARVEAAEATDRIVEQVVPPLGCS